MWGKPEHQIDVNPRIKQTNNSNLYVFLPFFDEKIFSCCEENFKMAYEGFNKMGKKAQF